jgi:hypothetical protein
MRRRRRGVRSGAVVEGDKKFAVPSHPCGGGELGWGQGKAMGSEEGRRIKK